jgi:TonB family protein
MHRVKLIAAACAALVLSSCSREPAPASPSSPVLQAAPVPAPAAAAPKTGRREAGPAPELTGPAFKKFAKGRSAEVRRCYEAALANDQTLRGKVTIQFAILPSGAVSDVSVARSSFRKDAVPACIATIVRGWRTPFRPEEAVTIEYPISFAPPR